MTMEYCKILDSIRRPSVLKPLQGVLAGALLGAVLLLALASAGVVSVYMKEFQFESAAKREAQLAAADGRPESEIRSELLQKAQSLGLPVDDSSIQIRITAPSPADQDTGNLLTALGVVQRSSTTGHVDITVSYGAPYRFPGGAKIIHFHFAVSDRGI
jgi:hypothetical protein